MPRAQLHDANDDAEASIEVSLLTFFDASTSGWVGRMRNKTVSLCDKSYEVARKMPNFSEWLRFQLLKPMSTPEEDRKNAPEYIKPKPQKNYLCRICRMAGHWTDDCKYELEGQ